MKLQIYANYHMRYVYGIYKFSCCLVGSPTKTQWWCVDINCMCVCVWVECRSDRSRQLSRAFVCEQRKKSHTHIFEPNQIKDLMEVKWKNINVRTIAIINESAFEDNKITKYDVEKSNVAKCTFCD